MDDELKRMIEEAAGVLKNAGAREVYIFGSVVNGSFNEKSDIDIAVTELPPENYFKAMGDAVDVIGRPVDLIDLDEVNPFTRYLKEEGELLRVGLTSNKEAGLMVNNKL